MRLNIFGGLIAAIIIVALIIAYGTFFTVYQTRQALVVRLGQPVRVVNEPGLNYKIPMIDSVIYVDKRILDLENPAQEVIASDQKRLVVDAFARYRIRHPLLFYQSVGTVEGANSRLSPKAAWTDGRPCVVQTVFWPPAPSSTSADVNVAPGGGTGMNGALQAHSSATPPSREASFRNLRRIAVMAENSPEGSQEQGAGRRSDRGKSGPWGVPASTRLAVFAT